MTNKRNYTDFENANAIINGMDDCVDEFVEGFVDLHNEPLNDTYMYEWLNRSLEDIIKVNHSVLHVACGTAGYTRLFRHMKRFVGIDFSNKMINAAKRIHGSNDSIEYEFHCTTLEKFDTSEKFDVIFMGPYGHYVPYTDEALQKAKSLLKSDGWIICTHPDPEFPSYWSIVKECIKQFLCNKRFGFSPVKRFEKILQKNHLEAGIKIQMKTSVGRSRCYLVR